MKNLILRPVDPQRDFAQLAAWFTVIEGESNTEASLTDYYTRAKERCSVRMAESEGGELLGFYWAVRGQSEPEKVTFDLYVKPEARGRGVGARLYDEMMRELEKAPVRRLRVTVDETCPEGVSFTGRRGFNERRHLIGMVLDLTAFDDRPYDAVIERLKGEGFIFTSMQALGNTEEAQRSLFALNDMTSSETPGTDGEHAWDSFEDFQKRVCQQDWFVPAGQMVVIDGSTGEWVALSAITRLAGNDYAYNLHTGVDKRYRGRKLAQAVKVLALRFARESLGVASVHTHHNTLNLPMIAIDYKLGYQPTPGNYLMEKKFG